MNRRLFVGMTLLSLMLPGAAFAQKKIPKAEGHNQCPLGYVNTLGSTCVSPIAYKVHHLKATRVLPAG